MIKSRRWITLLLALVTLLLIGWNLSENDEIMLMSNNDKIPTYTSANSYTLVYNSQGGLAYKLISDKITYFEKTGISWFNNPVMTTYDENKIPTWSMHADKAKLIKNHMLYLYGNVVLNVLKKDLQLKYIKTDNVKINLITQDVNSDDQATLYGQNFNSTGMKMHSNLRKKTSELIYKVKTSYEIQNQKKQS